MSNLLVVNELLARSPGDESYGTITRAMRETELKEALAEESRPEGLKILQSEAARRGMEGAAPAPTPEQPAGSVAVTPFRWQCRRGTVQA